jgi:hypothetical protein
MHDLVVRDLEQARNRTLGLTDLDDPVKPDCLTNPMRIRANVRSRADACMRLVGQRDVDASA